MITSIIEELAALSPSWLHDTQPGSNGAFDPLSPREQEMAFLVGDGAGDNEIAAGTNRKTRDGEMH